MNNILTIFAREPVAGRTKTRLCPPFDGASAAALYACFLRDVCAMAAGLPGVQALIAHTPESNPAFFQQFVPGMPVRPQCGATLGERMDDALRQALAEMPASAVLIGSDSPDLPAAFIHHAFAQLAAGSDLVLGPASDGGYYLIGTREPQPRLLYEVPMSTPTVLADTLAIAQQLNLRVDLLPTWHDVDTAGDVWALEQRLRDAPAAAAPATRRFLAQHRVTHASMVQL
ncbi:MAG: TIGR04282 family arsenosugar biosynthesis glycosyltransferase [Roseiflexaceae bacterium]|nr:TIGR04282 family arsenosugar biosynthesis glycosyltransferase [Roseiflexaceae bacterium]